MEEYIESTERESSENAIEKKLSTLKYQASTSVQGVENSNIENILLTGGGSREVDFTLGNKQSF